KEASQSPFIQRAVVVVLRVLDEVVMGSAVGPVELQGRLIAASWELVIALGPRGGSIGMHLGACAENGCRMPQAERPERQVHDVRGHVAERAGAVLPEAPPVRGVDAVAVVTQLGRAEPHFPVEMFRDGLRGAEAAVGPTFVAPVEDLADRADRTALDDLD